MSRDLVKHKEILLNSDDQIKENTMQDQVTVVHFFSSGFHPQWRVYCTNRTVQSSEYK